MKEISLVERLEELNRVFISRAKRFQEFPVLLLKKKSVCCFTVTFAFNVFFLIISRLFK